MVIEKCAMTDAGTYTAVGVNEVGKLTGHLLVLVLWVLQHP